MIRILQPYQIRLGITHGECLMITKTLIILEAGQSIFKMKMGMKFIQFRATTMQDQTMFKVKLPKL